MSEQDPPAKPSEIELFLAGDPTTIASVRKIIDSVISHRKYGIPRSERQDLAQQTLADLCRVARKPGFLVVKTLSCLVAYMAHCRCVDWLRKRQDLEAIPAGYADTAGSDKQIRITTTDDLTTKIMEKLPPACRWLMEMVIGLDIPYADVAAMTGRSEGALRVQMWTCLKKARKIHQNLDGGPPKGRPTGSGKKP
jgi:DNA-directed RNA polymerase specialized sigma24 family protein